MPEFSDCYFGSVLDKGMSQNTVSMLPLCTCHPDAHPNYNYMNAFPDVQYGLLHVIAGTIDALLCDKEADKVVDNMYTEISR